MDNQDTIYCHRCDDDVLYEMTGVNMQRETENVWSVSGWGEVKCCSCGRIIIEGHGPYLCKLDRVI